MPDTGYYKRIFKEKKICIIVPTFNNSGTIVQIINDLLLWTNNIIIVNDGSTDETKKLLKQFPNLYRFDLEQNKGKGIALQKGFSLALENDFDFAITIDADGQHLHTDLPVFLNKHIEDPDSIIIGSRNMNQEGIPKKSSFGHKFSNFWFRFETGINLSDTQSGYRLYPLQKLKKYNFFTNKYEFEIEVIVRAAWSGIPITTVPINVVYQEKEKRVSHFRPGIDFLRVSALNTILVLWAVFIIKPFKFIKRLNRKELIKFFKDNIIYSKDSNLKIAVSVFIGVLWGVLPVWGWQLALAITFAYLFKLNKIIVIASANISIPPMIPLILFLSYKTGGLVLSKNTDNFIYSNGLTLDIIKTNLYLYIVGSIVLAVVASVTIGLITFLLLSVFRHRDNQTQN